MLVSVVIVTRNRLDSLRECLASVFVQDCPDMEIIVVDNASEPDVAAQIPQLFPQVRLLRQEQNLGAAGGRNVGILAARGEICFSMDDDAILLGKDALSRCASYFRREEKLAVLALRIVDQHNHPVRKLIPRRDRKDVAVDTEGANFSGTGFVVRRDIFVQLGGFWDMLNPYFGEEPDYSYRVMDAGWRILITPFVNVRHYESPNERPPARRLYYGTRNAPWMAWRNMPWHAASCLTVLSLGYFFLKACQHGQMGMYLKALVASAEGLPEVLRLRKPMARPTWVKVHRCSGLLFY